MENQRNEKAIQIISDVNAIRKISKNNYRVLSQSQEKFYNVRKLPNADAWVCDCQDFLYRLTGKDDKRCKHIMSIQILQNAIDLELKIEKLDVTKICPKCNSNMTIKIGFRPLKSGLRRQKYECK